jgi:hypothetical protein
MDNVGEGCHGLCAVLFALCSYHPWRQSASPVVYAATSTKPNEILHFDFLYNVLSRNGNYQYLLLLKDDLSRHL